MLIVKDRDIKSTTVQKQSRLWVMNDEDISIFNYTEFKKNNS